MERVKLLIKNDTDEYLQVDYIYISMIRFDKSLIKALTSTYLSPGN